MTDIGRAEAGGTKVPALSKAIRVLRHLNASPKLSSGVTELADALDLSKSHCFNILQTLEREGWVEFDSERRKYVLSSRLLADFSGLLARPNKSAVIHEELVRLSLATRLPCVLSRVEPDGAFVAIDKAEAAAELLVSVPIGYRFPSDAPAQMRVRLAWLPPGERRAALSAWEPIQYTPTTITRRSQLERELALTLSRGYAVSRAEYTPGVMSLAAPIFDPRGRVVLIVQCPGLEADVTAREEEIARSLRDAAERIGAAVGARP